MESYIASARGFLAQDKADASPSARGLRKQTPDQKKERNK
jgi:hypothetical protein